MTCMILPSVSAANMSIEEQYVLRNLSLRAPVFALRGWRYHQSLTIMISYKSYRTQIARASRTEPSGPTTIIQFASFDGPSEATVRTCRLQGSGLN